MLQGPRFPGLWDIITRSGRRERSRPGGQPRLRRHRLDLGGGEAGRPGQGSEPGGERLIIGDSDLRSARPESPAVAFLLGSGSTQEVLKSQASGSQRSGVEIQKSPPPRIPSMSILSLARESVATLLKKSLSEPAG